MTHSKWRGHEIELKNDKWVYSDNKTLVSSDPHRNCGNCGAENRPDDHDSCLGELSGVKNACCGHGDADQAYIQFLDNSRMGGKEAVKWIIKERRE